MDVVGLVPTLLVLLVPAEAGVAVVAAEVGSGRTARCEDEDDPRDGSSRTRSLASTRMYTGLVRLRRPPGFSFLLLRLSLCLSQYPSSTSVSWTQGQRRE